MTALSSHRRHWQTRRQQWWPTQFAASRLWHVIYGNVAFWRQRKRCVDCPRNLRSVASLHWWSSGPLKITPFIAFCCPQIVPLLQHHATGARAAAVVFVAAAARALPPADVYTQLRALVAPRLTEPPITLDGG